MTKGDLTVVLIDRDLIEGLQRLGSKAMGAAREAVDVSADLVANRAAIMVRQRTGLLSRNIVARVKMRTAARFVSAVIGPAVGKGMAYGTPLEMGHAIVRRRSRWQKIRGSRTQKGKVPPYPYIQPAFEQAKDTAWRVMQRRLRELIDKGGGT